MLWTSTGVGSVIVLRYKLLGADVWFEVWVAIYKKFREKMLDHAESDKQFILQLANLLNDVNIILWLWIVNINENSKQQQILWRQIPDSVTQIEVE